MSDFLFINAPGATVPVGTERVRTRGYRVNGRGSADYVYDAAVTTGGPTTFVAADGRGFRLAPDQRITIDMFGAVPDDHGLYGTPGATNNYPAFQAAFDWLEANEVSPLPGFATLQELHVPIGFYYCNTQLELKEGAFTIVGQRGSRIRFPANSNGVIVHFGYTIGETTEAPGDSGANSALRNIAIVGSGGTNPNKHGVRCRALTLLEDVTVAEFSGNGVHILADIEEEYNGTAIRGNANQWTARTLTVIHNGRHGVYLQGGDVNAGCAIQINALNNGRWGVLDEGFLGNVHMGHHADSNGLAGAGCSANPNQSSSIVSHSGFRYSVMIGQATAASTTVPGTNEAVWAFFGEGAPSDEVPQWQSGGTYFEGGAFATTTPARNVFLGCYSEGSQGASQFSPQTLVIGGLPGAGVRGGTLLEAFDGSVRTGGVVTGRFDGTYAYVTTDQAKHEVLGIFDKNRAPLGYRLRFENAAGDLVLRYGDLDSAQPFTITGPASASAAGKHRFTVPAIGIGYGNDNRLFLVGGGQPPAGSGNWLQGTRIFYPNPVAGGREGVVCVASGAPGTWVEFGSIATS